jgi:hypothetical protein
VKETNTWEMGRREAGNKRLGAVRSSGRWNIKGGMLLLIYGLDGIRVIDVRVVTS